MGTLLNRRRYMGFSKGVEYLEFECPRMWELIAYNYGDVVDMRGKEIANGVLEGDDDTQVKSDVVFARGIYMEAHNDSNGNTITAKAARTVDYRIELEVTSGAGSNVPWNLDSTTMGTADTPIFQILEETGFTNGSTKAAATTFANVLSDGSTGWGSQEVLISTGSNKWYADFTSTVNTNYLQVAIRAASGVVVKWSIAPKSTSTNACWQPLGITKAQCEAVTTFGNDNNAIQKFRGNAHITKFNEFELFTGMTVLWGYHNTGRNSGFRNCGNLTEITFPDTLITLGQDCFIFAGVKSFDFKNINTIQYCCFGDYGITDSLLFNKPITIEGNNIALCIGAKYVDFADTLSGAFLYPNNGVVVLRGDTLPTLTNLYRNPKAIYVPAALLETYKTTSPWSSQANKFHSIEGTWYETHRSLDPNEP